MKYIYKHIYDYKVILTLFLTNCTYINVQYIYVCMYLRSLSYQLNPFMYNLCIFIYV